MASQPDIATSLSSLLEPVYSDEKEAEVNGTQQVEVTPEEGTPARAQIRHTFVRRISIVLLDSFIYSRLDGFQRNCQLVLGDDDDHATVENITQKNVVKEQPLLPWDTPDTSPVDLLPLRQYKKAPFRYHPITSPKLIEEWYAASTTNTTSN